MTWWEALDILDGHAVGHLRDCESRLKAIQVLTGAHTGGDEPPTPLSTEVDKVQPA